MHPNAVAPIHVGAPAPVATTDGIAPTIKLNAIIYSNQSYEVRCIHRKTATRAGIHPLVGSPCKLNERHTGTDVATTMGRAPSCRCSPQTDAAGGLSRSTTVERTGTVRTHGLGLLLCPARERFVSPGTSTSCRSCRARSRGQDIADPIPARALPGCFEPLYCTSLARSRLNS